MRIVQGSGSPDGKTPAAMTETSNRTITPADIARATAILDVDSKTRALMKLVPSAGNGSYIVTDASGWTIDITRGEVGCGDAHRFNVTARLRSQSSDPAWRGRVVYDESSELVISARRGAAYVDIDGIHPEKIGQHHWSRVHEMICRVVGTPC